MNSLLFFCKIIIIICKITINKYKFKITNKVVNKKEKCYYYY